MNRRSEITLGTWRCSLGQITDLLRSIKLCRHKLELKAEKEGDRRISSMLGSLLGSNTNVQLGLTWTISGAGHPASTAAPQLGSQLISLESATDESAKTMRHVFDQRDCN